MTTDLETKDELFDSGDDQANPAPDAPPAKASKKVVASEGSGDEPPTSEAVNESAEANSREVEKEKKPKRSPRKKKEVPVKDGEECSVDDKPVAEKPEQEETVREVAPEEPPVVVPEFIDLNEFQTRSLAALHLCAQEIGLRVAGVRSKHQLVFEILCFYGKKGTRIEAEGFIDFSGDSYGFLRWPALSFASNVDDVYVAANFVRKLELKPGNLVRAVVRPPREREKFLSVEEVISVEGKPTNDWQPPVPFDQLTPLFPKDRIILEH
ncbi:MAG: hypothetical protein KDN20_10580, partial [Verrucomicrobiae bacterium]|nr:hypothetical protein [Verrucomicrobiae bacterium]